MSPSYFSTLQVQPALGRFFGLEQESQSEAPTVVVSYRFWQSSLNSDPSMVGKTVQINGHTAAILGVGPRDFLGASPMFFAADIWMPVKMDPGFAPELGEHALEQAGLPMLQMVGRLRPGVSVASAEAALDTVARQVAVERGESQSSQKGRHVLLVTGGKVLPIREQDLPFFTSFFLVMGGLVLLLACSNVANMMLARAGERRREIAIRLALGAGRARLIRQLLTESMLIAVVAGGAGFLLSTWLMHMLSHQSMPLPMPVRYDLNTDRRAFFFALAISAVTGIAFGLAPALQATNVSLTPALKEGGDLMLRVYGRLSLRNVLVVCQMCASLTLLLLTAYLGFGIQSSLGVQQGFDARNLFLISVDPIRAGYSGPQAVAFFQKLTERVKRIPTVRAVALTDTVPVALNGNPGVVFSSAKQVHSGHRYLVGKGYFETTGIPILSGRGFEDQDEFDTARTVVVSQALASELWKGEDAVGRTIEIGSGEVAPSVGAFPGSFDFRQGALAQGRRVFEIVGVAGDVAEGLVASKPGPAIYFPLEMRDYAQPSLRGMTLLVRGVPGADVMSAVRREIALLDADLTPFNARSMDEQIAQFMTPLRSASWTYGMIGIFGLILASVGLAGVTAYSVARRVHEIGIRLALGAQRGTVLALVMKEGAALVLVGTAAGLGCAWAGIRMLAAFSFSVGSIHPNDPILVVGAPVLLAGLALFACLLPALRSMSIDPVVALREE